MAFVVAQQGEHLLTSVSLGDLFSLMAQPEDTEKTACCSVCQEDRHPAPTALSLREDFTRSAEDAFGMGRKIHVLRDMCLGTQSENTRL